MARSRDVVARSPDRATAQTEWDCKGKLGCVRITVTDGGVSRLRFLPSSSQCRPWKQVPEGWLRQLLSDLRDYLDGEEVSFDEVPLDLDGVSSFRRKVLDRCRRIPYGKTLTYGELAAKVGKPSAYRAVGTAMSHNPVSLIIPCHRVLGSNGGFGGYSAPRGIALKRDLLEAEGVV